MVTDYKFCRASICSALLLGLLPLTTYAKQQSKPGQTENVPIFAESLTRPRLGNIPHLSDTAAAEARMTPPLPNNPSHMVVMGEKTDVWCPRGKFIELAPDLNIVGFKPETISVYENNKLTQVIALNQKYTLRIDPPAGELHRKEVVVVVNDARGAKREVMRCIVRDHIANPTIAELGYEKQKEQCGFKIKDSQSFKNTCLYLGDMYLGQVGEDAGRVDVDERLLPPGKYSCQMVGKNSDDIYVPGASSAFSVDNRYEIKCANSSQEIVIGEHDDEKLNVTIKHTPGLSIKKTRVYIAGILAGEKEGDDFTMPLPTKDVPPGNCFIEVIGVAEDGVTYPVESLPIKIKNEPWMVRFTHTDEYALMEDYDVKISQLWQDVRANLVRAKFEPGIYMDSKTCTLESITRHYAVGDKAKFQEAAERAFVQMTQYQLKSARICRSMKMRTKACSLYKNVVREVGLSSPDGIAAKEELEALRKPSAASSPSA